MNKKGGRQRLSVTRVTVAGELVKILYNYGHSTISNYITVVFQKRARYI